MAIEDLVDDFWREVLATNANAPQAQAKWDALIGELQKRVAHFPDDAQKEVFLRADKRNAECTAIASVSLDALKAKLGMSMLDKDSTPPSITVVRSELVKLNTENEPESTGILRFFLIVAVAGLVIGFATYFGIKRALG